MKFNPEDGLDVGPHCRNCHKGSSACGTCHNDGMGAYTSNEDTATVLSLGKSTYDVDITSTDDPNSYAFSKVSQTVIADDLDWRSSEDTVSISCSDDGFSWPHRTLGWKMLKDDLFGLDFDGTEVGVDEVRDATLTAAQTAAGMDVLASKKAHDLDSVCLDCHNPTIWNASKNTTDPDDPTKNTHYDDPTKDSDNYDDELLLRGLP